MLALGIFGRIANLPASDIGLRLLVDDELLDLRDRLESLLLDT